MSPLLRVGDDFDERFGSFDRRAAKLFPLVFGVFLAINLREERCKLVVLILRPAFKRVIVALVAIEPNRQEELPSCSPSPRRDCEAPCNKPRVGSRRWTPTR